MEEKTKDYIRIESSFVRLFLVALILVFVAGTIWGVTGDIPVTNTVQGYVFQAEDPDSIDGEDLWKVVCFVDASSYAGSLLIGNDAVIKMVDGNVLQSKVSDCDDFPMSVDDFSVIYHIPDWMLTSLANGDYMYGVTIDLDESAQKYVGQMAEVSIVIDHKKPFELL